jgi:hypothetical protein
VGGQRFLLEPLHDGLEDVDQAAHRALEALLLADPELLVEAHVLPEPRLVAIEVGQDRVGPRPGALLHETAQAAQRARRLADGLGVAPEEVLLLVPPHLREGQAGVDVHACPQVPLDVLAGAP